LSALIRFIPDLLGCGVVLLLGGLLVYAGLKSLFWIGSVVYAPHTELNQAELSELEPAQQSIRNQLSWRIGSNVILKPLGGKSLDIYLGRERFEDIPYPNRQGFVDSVGKNWCDKVDHAYLPTVRIRDLRTGDTLGRYHCASWYEVYLEFEWID